MSASIKLPQLNRSLIITKKYPTKILQFGDGNFLRAFIDWIFNELNNAIDFNAGITIIKARPGEGKLSILNEQDGLYTLFLKGIKNGEEKNEQLIIDCINEGINPYEDYERYIKEAANSELQFIVSNTTEAGIVFNANDKLLDTPQSTFPGKITAFLYERYKIFNKDVTKGFIFFPCELIDNNGDKLQEIILKYAALWNLEQTFIDWIINSNTFCNTLVDRIVSGYPKNKIEAIQEKLGYEDKLIVEAEFYHLFVIESKKNIETKFPANSMGLNVVFTKDIKRYKTIKVRILNGAHTTLVPVAYLYGIDKVRESIENNTVLKFLEGAIFNNICPTLDFPTEEINQFSIDVLDRFRNPFIEHELMSISLNSISKYKTRVLPSVLEFIKRKNELPSHLLFSLAALIVFYKGNRNGTPINLKDDKQVLDFFTDIWVSNNHAEVVGKVLSNTSFWGTDLTEINGLKEEVIIHLENILSIGMTAALKQFVLIPQ